jgi:hypothetical protein
MRIRKRWIALGALLVGIAVCVWTATRWKTLSDYHWQQVQVQDAQFSITFPANATTLKETLTASDGSKFISNKLTSSPAHGVIYAVNWWENSLQNDKSTDELFASFRDCGMKAFGGRVVREKRLSVQGYPAQDTAVLAEGGVVAVNRVIRVQSRFYSLWVIDSLGHVEKTDIKKFMDSFTVRPT